jgi:hypothetical protein
MTKQADKDVRLQRMMLLKEIGKLIQEQEWWHRTYILPAVSEAKMRNPMSRPSGSGGLTENKPLKLEIADALGDVDPTDRFEKGRAHVEHLSSQIKALRRQEAKLGRVVMAPSRRQTDWVGRLERRAKKLLEKGS